MRYRDGCALIQLSEGQQDLYEAKREEIKAMLGQYYSEVILDELVRKNEII